MGSQRRYCRSRAGCDVDANPMSRLRRLIPLGHGRGRAKEEKQRLKGHLGVVGLGDSA